jgi:hypothetical protein
MTAQATKRKKGVVPTVAKTGKSNTPPFRPEETKMPPKKVI